MFRSRKAIAPLIAEVLLVVVAVSIGAAIFSLVQHYMTSGKQDIKEGAEEIRCGRDVGIELHPMNFTYICNASAKDTTMASFNMIVSNVGTRDIEQAQLRVFFEGGIFSNNSILNGTLKPGQSEVINVTYDPKPADEWGALRSAQVIPRIGIPGVSDFSYCTDNAWEVKDINQC